jgi:calmodulin
MGEDHGSAVAPPQKGPKPKGGPPMVSWKRSTMGLVAIVVLAMVIPSSTDALSENTGTPAILAVTSNATLIILTALVSIALFFEFMHHKLSHGTAEVYIPVLHALMGELMGIGFLAIIFYFLVKFKALVNASKSTVCQKCDPCSGGTCVMGTNETSGLATIDSWGKYVGRRLVEEQMAGTDAEFTYRDVYGVPEASTMWEAAARKWSSPAHTHSERRLAAYVEKAMSGSCKVQNPTFGTSVPGNPEFAGKRRMTDMTIEERHEYAWGKDWRTNANLPGRALSGVDVTDGHGRKLATPAEIGQYTCECYHCDEALLHLFEDVHMGLFLVLVLFFIRAVMLLRQVEAIGELWRTMEAQISTIQDGEKMVVKQYYEGKKTIQGVNSSAFMHFTMLRMRFLRTAAGGKPLKDDFSFAEYLNIIFGHTASHIVHIPVRAWCVLEVFFIFFWAAMTSEPFLRVRCFALFVFIGSAVAAVMLKKYREILDELTMPYDLRSKGKSAAAWQKIEQDWSAFADGKPPYLTHDGSAGKTQHDALFWGGKSGPDFMMHTIRLLQIIMLIFFVLLGFAVPFSYTYDKDFFPIVCLCIPIVLFGSYTLPQELLKLHCLTTSIELKKNPHAIKETIRKVKFAKSIRTLALLRSLQGFAELEEMKKDDGSAAPVAVAETPKEEDDPKGKANCKEIFDVFDADGSGEIAIDEMGSLLASMGMELTQSDLAIIVKKFDTGGDGTISFEEFWAYMKSRKAKINPEQVVAQVFAMIDSDGSGCITAEEFSDTLRKLPTEISEEDINALVREIDSGGDGEISLHEFAHVLNKYI